MGVFAIICGTFVAITIIAVTGSTVQKCSYNKWRSKNPEAFESKVLNSLLFEDERNKEV